MFISGWNAVLLAGSKWMGYRRFTIRNRQQACAVGAHAYSIQLQAFLDFYDHLPARPLDIMLECKDKDISAIKCQMAINARADQRLIEEE